MEKEVGSMRPEFVRLLLGLAVLVIIAGSFALYASFPLLSGKTIVLATRPVDPFDPFRGQYIVIGYEVGSIVPNPLSSLSQGDTVYVSLKEDDVPTDGVRIWRYNGVSVNRPSEGVFLKGTVMTSAPNWLRIEYGIEQYFFERGAELPRSNISVEVKVASDGRAAVSDLLYLGKSAKLIYRNVTLTS